MSAHFTAGSRQHLAMSGPPWVGAKRLARFSPLALPPMAVEVLERVRASGAQACALFGGALRDADLGALWGSEIPIKDYDLRIWLPASEMSALGWELSLASSLKAAFDGSPVELAPSLGTGRARHVLHWRGIEIDASARPAPWAGAASADCAAERALDSDASLCSVAYALGAGAFCEAQYLSDSLSGSMGFYPSGDLDRMAAYKARMAAKFPLCQIHDLAAPARLSTRP